MNIGANYGGGGDGAARDEEAIARLLVSGGLLRRRRVRRLLLARLLNEARESGEDEEHEGYEGAEGEGEEGGESDHKLAKVLIASGILRRRRMRRMILAHLLRERGGGEEFEPEFGEHEGFGFGGFGFGGFEGEEAGPSSEHRIAKFLIASGILRRRRIRRMVLAHLLRERGGEGFEPEFGMFGEGEEAGPSSDRRLAKFLIVSGILHRRRVRRMVLAHLLRERGGEGMEPEFEGAETGEEGGGDRKIVRFLVASGLLRKRRLRRMLLAHLLRERGEGGGEFGREGAEMEGGEEHEGEEEAGWGGGFGAQRGRRRFEEAFA